jgi:hypothetical protein
MLHTFYTVGLLEYNIVPIDECQSPTVDSQHTAKIEVV